LFQEKMLMGGFRLMDTHHLEILKEYKGDLMGSVANNVMYEIKDDLGKKQLVDIDGLKSYTIDLVQYHELEMVNEEGWFEFVYPEKKLNSGFVLSGFKSALSDGTIFTLCTQILSKLHLEVYRLIGDNLKEKLGWTVVIPGSKYDNDQILHQMGFDSSQVSKMDIYSDNKHIASYGSVVVGEQDVRCYNDEHGNPVPVGEGDEERIFRNPKLLVERHKLQREKMEEYLHYSNNCWLESIFEDADGNDLTVHSEQLQADAECVHGAIEEGIGIGKETITEIVAACKRAEESRR